MSPTSFILFFCAHNVLAIPGIEIPVGRRLYTGYKILRATPQTPQQRAALLVLEEGNLWRVNQGCKNMPIFLTPDVPSLILPNVILL